MKFYSTTVFEVERNRQVLLEGSWTGDHCHWDWESSRTYYEDYSEAEKAFRRSRVTKNIPIIRLYETTFDEYGNEDYRNLLEEKF